MNFYTDIWGRVRSVRPSIGMVLPHRGPLFKREEGEPEGGGGGVALADKKTKARQVVIEIVREAFTPQLEAMEAQKNQIAELKGALEKLRTAHTTAIAVPGMSDELTKTPYLISRAIYAHVLHCYGNTSAWERYAPYEKEINEQGLKYAGEYGLAVDDRMKRRTVMEVGDDSLGGFWVPEQVAEQFFIETLQPSTALLKLPIQRLTGLTANPIIVPKETGDLTGYWVGENEAITESNLGAGQVTFRPHELGALVKLSARLLREASIGTEAFVKSRIGNRFARAIDLAGFKGTGSANQPLGLLNWAIQTNAASADPPTVVSTWEDLSDIINKLETANVPDNGDWSWVFHAKAKGAFRKFLTGDASNSAALPFWTQDPTVKGIENNLLGYPHTLMNQLATNLGGATDETEIVFGAWASYLFLQWAGFEIAVSAETSDAFAKRQVWIRAIQEVDMGPLQESAFVLMNDYQV